MSASYGPTPGWKADDKVRYLQTILDTHNIWDSSRFQACLNVLIPNHRLSNNKFIIVKSKL